MGGRAAPHRPGMVVGGKFVLLRVIAEGAMGAVYEAKDTLIQRHVAIKLLHPEFNRNPDFIRRFRREAEATASVQHPNVVVVLEMGQRRDGSFYIVQELLTGSDLRVHLHERKRFRVEEALEIMIPVMGALAAAHHVGIVHRDVKPDNIVLARGPTGEIVPKLIDFGVARVHSPQGSLKATQVGTLLGTLSYMSPEQVKAQHPLDGRTDVWAVGVVLYELLSGVCPYAGPSEQAVILKIVTEPPPRIEEVMEGVPDRLAAAMRRALEPDQALRYPTMAAFRDDLLELLGGARRLLSAPLSTAAPPALEATAPLPPVIAAPPPRAPASTPPSVPSPRGGIPGVSPGPPSLAAVATPLPAPPSPASVAAAAAQRARGSSRPTPPPARAPLRDLSQDPASRPWEPSRRDVGEQWLDPDDLVAIDDGPPSRDERSAARQRQLVASRDEMDWDYDRTTQMPRAPGFGAPRGAPGREPHLDADAAEHALSVNKLREAIALAARALAARLPAPDVTGRMLLVQAIAHRWLGDYAAAERCAREATRRLERGAGAWYAALGYLVIASGCLGKGKPLLDCYEEVRQLEVTEDRRSQHVILLCRLSIFLLRVGLPNVAHEVARAAEDLSGDDDAGDSIVRAWLDAARAEVAMHRGDLTTYLRRIESAVESFTVRGDVRNACMQRANIGNAYMQLGAYRRAVSLLEEALRVAEPMELDLIAGVKVNLGFALAQLGQLDRGIEVEEAALADCARQSSKRFEGCSRIYLATMRLWRGEAQQAGAIARQALAGLEDGSAIRAYALGTLARVMLAERQPALALRHAEEAFELMSSLGGVEEGESLIRAVYALALQATGDEAEGRRQIAEARRRLLERADRIHDPLWRRSFLENVADNAWAMALAAEWLGSGQHPGAPPERAPAAAPARPR